MKRRSVNYPDYNKVEKYINLATKQFIIRRNFLDKILGCNTYTIHILLDYSYNII